jgi:hypothetical protein
MNNHAAGISIIAFIVTVMASMGYYQFVYIMEEIDNPQLRE